MPPVARLALPLLAALLGLATLPVHGQGGGARERSIFVTVTDQDGAPVTGLSPSEFVVREDGRRREVLGAFQATEPVTVALMVDNSAAAEPYVADMRSALKAFVERIGGKYPTALTTVAERPRIRVEYTLDKQALLEGVQRIFAVPGSAAYFVEGLLELSRGLAARDFERAAIVAITAEGPEYSERHYTQALPQLRESGAMFEAFVLSSRGGPDLREEGSRSRSVLLDRGTRETGGDRIELLTSMGLERALANLAARLEAQHKVTYARPESLIPPEKIEVAVTRPGLTARGTPARPAGTAR